MKVQILSLLFLIASGSAADFTCPEQFDPQNPTFFPHPDCTKYFVCDWQSIVERNCPPGLHWNEQANYCDYPGQAGCVEEPVVTPSTPSSTPTTGKPASDRCPEEYNPNEVPTYLPHEDCTKYYFCSWEGQAVEQDCPAGLHWSQADRNCENPEEAGCSDAGIPAVPSGECPEVYDPTHQVYFPHEGDCTKYYICTYEGAKLEQSCPAGLHWSEVNNYCDHPDRAQCKIAIEGLSTPEVTTEQVTTEEGTTEEGTTQETPVECPLSEDQQDVPVFLPHESDCTKYYVCEHGRPTPLECPAGLFWNAVENTCDNPAHSGCIQRVLLRLW